jgi:hypothetical protein
LEAIPVLIAGAGPVGLATAIELQSRGIRVMVVERNATTTRHPKMDVTNGRSMEHFRRIGIAERIRDAGVARENVTITEGNPNRGFAGRRRADCQWRQTLDHQCSSGRVRRRPFMFAWNMLWAAAAIFSMPTRAVDLQLGIPGLDASLVTDLRYNVGMRVHERDPTVALSTSFAHSDYRFGEGSVVTDRVDLTPQLQAQYNAGWKLLPSFGIRVSGNAFKDFAYHFQNTACRPGTAPVGLPPGFLGPNFPGLVLPGQRPSYCDPRLSNYNDATYDSRARRSAFNYAELLDAFTFLNFQFGDVPVNVKAGHYALFWGEALFNPFLGVSAGMGPIDLNKALTLPGSNAQDLFRPINQISATATLNESVSLGFQYFLPWLGWDSVRAPEGGTYLGLLDGFIYAPQRLYLTTLPFVGPYSLVRGSDDYGDNHGNFGLQAKINSHLLFDATYGFYYRQFDETLPWVNPQPATPQNQPALFAGLPQLLKLLGITNPSALPPLPGDYRLVFPKNTRLYGLSLSTQQLGISFGADIAYSPNRALQSQLFFTDESGQRARGETLSGVFNALYLTPPVSMFGSRLWDSASLAGEINWSYLLKVTENPQFYKGVNTNACRSDAATSGAPFVRGDTVDGCASRYSIGLSVLFQPTWFQVLPGVDFNATASLQDGLFNDSPINSGSFEGQVTGSFGIGAIFNNKITAALAYNFYNVQHRTGRNLDGELVDTTFNFLGDIRDRDWVSLTLKYSF